MVKKRSAFDPVESAWELIGGIKNSRSKVYFLRSIAEYHVDRNEKSKAIHCIRKIIYEIISCSAWGREKVYTTPNDKCLALYQVVFPFALKLKSKSLISLIIRESKRLASSFKVKNYQWDECMCCILNELTDSKEFSNAIAFVKLGFNKIGTCETSFGIEYLTESLVKNGHSDKAYKLADWCKINFADSEEGKWFLKFSASDETMDNFPRAHGLDGIILGFISLGEFEKAECVLKMLPLCYQKIEILIKAGEALTKAGNSKKALYYLRRAIALEKKSVEQGYSLDISRALAPLGDNVNALSLLKGFLKGKTVGISHEVKEAYQIGKVAAIYMYCGRKQLSDKLIKKFNLSSVDLGIRVICEHKFHEPLRSPEEIAPLFKRARNREDKMEFVYEAMEYLKSSKESDSHFFRRRLHNA